MKHENVLLCNESKYSEFPRMLFGTSENGRVYFDVTVYTEKKEEWKNLSISDFQQKFFWWISLLSEAYSVPVDKMIVTNSKDGHLLMEESLSLLFASYLDPVFGIYMLERISEMLVTGIVLSDAALVSMAKDRLTKDDFT